MAMIVDYFKNDRIYNAELIDLIPTNLEWYCHDKYLKRAVETFDELTFGNRKELSEIATNVKCNKDTLIYNIDDKVNIGYYYDLLNAFYIKAYISSECAIGNIPFIVEHIFNQRTHIIKVERDYNYGYIPVLDLKQLNEAYTKNFISKEGIKVVTDELELVNRSLDNFYGKKLIKKK